MPRGGFSPSNHTDDGMVIRGHEKSRLLEKDEITLILGCQTGPCMKRATDPKGKKIKEKTKPKLEAIRCNREAHAWLSGVPVVCVLYYRQLSVVSLLALKNFEQHQREI